MIKDHNKYMLMAIKEADLAYKKKEVPVGAVIIKNNGKVISKDHNSPISQCDPTAHAEIKVLKSAAFKLQNYRLIDTTLYVTMEPCIMCMGAIIHARVSTLVFGAFNIKWGAAGSIYNFAIDNRLNHKIQVIKEVNLKKCRELIRNFFKQKKSNLNLKNTII